MAASRGAPRLRVTRGSPERPRTRRALVLCGPRRGGEGRAPPALFAGDTDGNPRSPLRTLAPAVRQRQRHLPTPLQRFWPRRGRDVTRAATVTTAPIR